MIQMLKVYNIHSYVSINGAEWVKVGQSGYTMTDTSPTEHIILENVGFSECYNYLKEHILEGIYIDNTIFNKPQMCIHYDIFDNRYYKKFNNISYKKVYSERKDVSLVYIMEHFPAEKCIQYLKERGVNTCPIYKIE